MTENGIIPFRTLPEATFEPIDPDSVPDCGAREMAKLNEDIAAVSRDRDLCITAKSEVVARKIFNGVFPMAGFVILVGAWLQLYSILAAFGYAVAALFGTFFVSAIATNIFEQRSDEKSQEIELLRIRQGHEKRLRGLVSLERLTGKNAMAKALREEACRFNRLIGDLDLDFCSASDQDMISQVRGDIVKRIGDFRQKMLGAAPEPLQLVAGEADRT